LEVLVQSKMGMDAWSIRTMNQTIPDLGLPPVPTLPWESPIYTTISPL
jgi:hypothetical protein